ncbi:hypothetical protein CERSUDRAFT_94836 [Gelatoporia subvermispora B]|uniref:Uncharacterized protein n=1 Tax=Ceriporiopsis subvermispora (strain B) TaxID=914234 RepID=M2PN37_CERS8|nr:hypothetical protein CERSUDRAFT_94836 [Gelatoporia subvermispora B]
MVNTHATIEAGVLVGSMLYGVVTIQAFSYIEAGKKDATWIRLFIAWMWILETGNTALAWVYLNQLTVFGPGVNDPTALGRIYWSFVACIVSHDCLSAAVQSFYAYRLYVLSGRIAFSLVQWIGSVLRIAFIFTLLGFALSAPSLGELLIQHRGLAIGTVSTSAIVDMWNTAMLCWHLKKFHRE